MVSCLVNRDKGCGDSALLGFLNLTQQKFGDFLLNLRDNQLLNFSKQRLIKIETNNI